MATSSILGQYEANLNSQAGTDRIATDKDTFLKLLVAQLTHQDPLNPTEDKEFIAQLAQFTTVEELQNIRTSVDAMQSTFLMQQATNAAGIIGREVLAEGNNVYLYDSSNMTEPVSLSFSIFQAMTTGMMNVYQAYEDGSQGPLVYSEIMGAYNAGTHQAQWYGKDYNGQYMPNGSYIMEVIPYDENGNQIYAMTTSTGLVIGVEVAADGNHMLYLADGRTVNFSDVGIIQAYISSGTDPEPEPEPGGGTGEGGGDNGGSTGGGSTGDGNTGEVAGGGGSNGTEG